MSISSVSLGGSSVQSLFQQRRTDFQSLARAVQSGDIKSAQSALTAYQADMQKLNPQQNSAAPAYSRNPRLQTDLSNLATAVQGGNVTDAQTALSAYQQDRDAVHSQDGQQRQQHEQLEQFEQHHTGRCGHRRDQAVPDHHLVRYDIGIDRPLGPPAYGYSRVFVHGLSGPSRRNCTRSCSRNGRSCQNSISTGVRRKPDQYSGRGMSPIA
jgi:hypothetical protein